ncbi:hypothetical protein, partial [Glutamicibacter soli]
QQVFVQSHSCEARADRHLNACTKGSVPIEAFRISNSRHIYVIFSPADIFLDLPKLGYQAGVRLPDVAQKGQSAEKVPKSRISFSDSLALNELQRLILNVASTAIFGLGNDVVYGARAAGAFSEFSFSEDQGCEFRGREIVE